MKLRIRCDSVPAFPVELPEDGTVAQLTTVVGERLSIAETSFSLSLNRTDRLPSETEAALKSLGLVSGDTVFVHISVSEASNETNVMASLAPFSDLLKSLLGGINASTQAEVVVALLYVLLKERNFTETDGPSAQQLTEEYWKQCRTTGYYKLSFRHPSSEVALELAIAILGRPEVAVVTALIAVGASSETVRLELNVNEMVQQLQNYAQFESAQDLFKENIQALANRLRKHFIADVYRLVVGDPNPLLRLPTNIQRRILERIPVRSVLASAQTCQTLYGLVRTDQPLWRSLLLRDFEGEGSSREDLLKEAEAAFEHDYRACYVAKAIDQRNRRREAEERARRIRQERPMYIPPSRPRNPEELWMPERPLVPGLIGGPHDLIPGGPINPPHFPNLLDPSQNLRDPNRPGMGGIAPRFDPFRPDLPDFGIDPNPDRPGGSRRGRHPQNPFGGGGGFPGFM